MFQRPCLALRAHFSKRISEVEIRMVSSRCPISIRVLFPVCYVVKARKLRYCKLKIKIVSIILRKISTPHVYTYKPDYWFAHTMANCSNIPDIIVLVIVFNNFFHLMTPYTNFR